MPEPIIYEVYLDGRETVLIMSAFSRPELEKMLCLFLNAACGCNGLAFMTYEENGSTFFTGQKIGGFYREAN